MPFATEMNIVDSFNDSAVDNRDGRLTAGLLARKYEALIKYKAETPEIKNQLAAAMFDAAEALIKKVGVNPDKDSLRDFGFVSRITPLLEALAASDSIGFIPDRAPQALADMTVNLANRAGKLTADDYKASSSPDHYYNNFREQATVLSGVLMQYADLFAKAIDERKASTKPATPRGLTQ